MRSETSSATCNASKEAIRTFFLVVIDVKEENGERHRG